MSRYRRNGQTIARFIRFGRQGLWAFVMAGCVACSLAAIAQQAAKDAATSTSAKPASAPKVDVTAEQQATVQEFVQRNHPELNVLLTYLEQHRPQEYKRAVRDLYRNVARIESLRERDAERYELELRLWQLQSRSQLLAARLTMLDEKQREEELRQLLREQANIRVAILRRERDRVQERLAKLNQQINELQENREALVQKELETLLRATRAATPTAKRAAASTAKNANQAPANKINDGQKKNVPRNRQ